MAIPSTGQHVRGAPAPRQLPVEVGWGLAYEALIGLGMFIGSEAQHTYEVGDAWFQSVRRRASTQLREAGRRLVGNEGYGLTGLTGMAHETGGRSVASLVALIRKDRSKRTKWALLHCETSLRDAIQRGDAAARRTFLKRMHKGSREAAERVLQGDPQAIAMQTADLLEQWDGEIFSELGPPLEGELKASAQSIARLARQLPTDRLIVKATRGVEYRPEPWINQIVLLPTVLNRPWVDITEEGSTKYFFYPASADSAVPDVQLVEIYKALGDETRLRILRLLAGGETSLTDIAEKLGLAKSTIHGHMVILRMAGLTRSLVGGGESKGRYVLNERPDLNSLLDAYLK